MHSRKFPRLDEGIYDRGQSRSYQVSGRSYSKDRVYDRGEREHSPVSLDRAREREVRDRERDARDRYYGRPSPERSNSYSNKYRSSSSRGSEYIDYRGMDRDRDRDRDRERDRGERDRLERPSRPLERMDVTGANGRGSLASRSKDYGRVSPHEHPPHRPAANHHANASTLASTVVPRSRDAAPSSSATAVAHGSSAHRGPGTSGSFPSSSSSSSSSANASSIRPTEAASGTSGGASATTGATADIPKKALRVSGDWSEYVSSSGKRYYYNCKTEVSQWEKPKDWISPLVPPSEPRAGPSSNVVGGSGKYLSSTVASHRPREEAEARESRPAPTTSARAPETCSSSREHPREVAPRYVSREASPTTARYAAVPARDREKDARDATQHGRSCEVRDSLGRDPRNPPEVSKGKEASSRSSTSMTAVFRAGSKRPATSPNAKDRSVSPVGRHGSRTYVPGTDGNGRSRPRGDERPRPPISSVVTSSGLHQSMDVDPSPRDHEDSHLQHHHHHSSNSSPGRHVESVPPHSSHASLQSHPSSSAAALPRDGREREMREGRERDAPSLHSDSRRVIDSSSSNNPLSRLGKAFHDAAPPQNYPGSAPGHVSDPHSVPLPTQPSAPPPPPSSSSSSSHATTTNTTAAGGSAHACPTSSSEANLTTQQALQTLQQALLMAKGKNGEITSSSATSTTASSGHPVASRHGSNGASVNLSSTTRLSPAVAPGPQQQQHHSSQASPFHQAQSTQASHGGPPIPSSSQAAQNSASATSSVRTSGLASLGGGAGQVSSHQSTSRDVPETRTSHASIALSGIQALNNKLSAMTQISPSLAQYYKEELIAHIMGWQADAVEKQASLIAAEGLNIGALNCTRVSGDLKAARSLVRVHDILSTLQEQRLKVVKAWMKDLDYFPHVAGIPFHPPSSSPNSVTPNGLSSLSAPLTNGLAPFIPPPSSTGVGWGAPSSLPPIPPPSSSSVSQPAPPTDAELPSLTHSAPCASSSSSSTSSSNAHHHHHHHHHPPPLHPPPSAAFAKHENIPSATKPELSSATAPVVVVGGGQLKKERSFSASSGSGSTTDPARPPPPISSSSSRKTEDDSKLASKPLAVGANSDVTTLTTTTTTTDVADQKLKREESAKTDTKAAAGGAFTHVDSSEENVREQNGGGGDDDDASPSSSRSRSNSNDKFPVKKRDIDVEAAVREERYDGDATPASKRTKLDIGGNAAAKNPEALVKVEKAKRERSKSGGTAGSDESRSTTPKEDFDNSVVVKSENDLFVRANPVNQIPQPKDSKNEENEENSIDSPSYPIAEQRSSSPVSDCRLTAEFGCDELASSTDAVVTSDVIPNGPIEKIGDERLSTSPTTVVAN